MFDKNLIQYRENFIPVDLAKELFIFLKTSPWYFGGRSIDYDRNVPHWSIRFAGGKNGGDSITPCVIENPLIQRVWETVKFLHEGQELVRCYANASTTGQDNRVHTDSPFADSLSTIVYVNETWHIDWGGETIVWDRNNRQIVSGTLPKFRSILTMPGNYWHGVRPISRYCDTIRMTLMFKTLKLN